MRVCRRYGPRITRFGQLFFGSSLAQPVCQRSPGPAPVGGHGFLQTFNVIECLKMETAGLILAGSQ